MGCGDLFKRLPIEKKVCPGCETAQKADLDQSFGINRANAYTARTVSRQMYDPASYAPSAHHTHSLGFKEDLLFAGIGSDSTRIRNSGKGKSIQPRHANHVTSSITVVLSNLVFLTDSDVVNAPSPRSFPASSRSFDAQICFVDALLQLFDVNWKPIWNSVISIGMPLK